MKRGAKHKEKMESKWEEQVAQEKIRAALEEKERESQAEAKNEYHFRFKVAPGEKWRLDDFRVLKT